MHRRAKRPLFVLLILLLAWFGNAQASFTGITFFGDSLSDTGNVLTLTTTLAPPPFPNFPAAPGRFSNGPVWTETLAASLGLPTAAGPSNLLFNGSAVVPIGPLGGENFSFGGARTGLGGSAGATTGLLGQLVAWNGVPFGGTLTRAADPNALYVVMGGVSDMRDFRSGTPGSLTPAQAATNVVNVIGLLAQAGAQHFLISNAPDLGETPEAAGLGLVPQSTAASLAFNAALMTFENLLDASFLAATGIDLDIRTLDLFHLGQVIFDDAVNDGGATFGITNVTAPCITPGGASGQFFAPDAVAVACDTAAFSDPLHPSAVVHRLIGQTALASLGIAAVPEPGTLALVLSALLMVGRARRGACKIAHALQSSRAACMGCGANAPQADDCA